MKTPGTLSEPLFAASTARTSDSEFDQFFGYMTRQLERVVTTHALSWSLEGASSSNDVRLVDEDGEVAEEVVEGRRTKKKKLALLLPILLFLKLKFILIKILLKVMFIKKLLIVGAFFIPTFLSYFKQGRATEHHGHHESHDAYHGAASSYDNAGDYSNNQDSYSAPSHYQRRRSGQKRRAQDMAYQAYQEYYNQLNQGRSAEEENAEDVRNFHKNI